MDPTTGLSDSQVAHNRSLYGRNEMPPEDGVPFWKLVLKQFDDLLVKILLVAALISFLLALGDGGGESSAFVEPFVSSFEFVITEFTSTCPELVEEV